MKKIITLTLFSFLSASLLSQSGRVRISFVGFDCYRETWDDILHTDGKGDEVYFTFGFSQADRNGNSKRSYDFRTKVYGDATGQFSNRISAGTCVDLFGGAKGGIKAGDGYRCNDVIGEYDLADGDILTIVPTAWEYDPNADDAQSFVNTVKGAYNAINQKLAPVMMGLHLLAGDLGSVVLHAGNYGLTKIRAGGDQGELGRPGTRPIGMEKYGDYSPKLVVLNTPNLATITNSNIGNGNGVVAVNYDEAALGNSRDHGNYNILLKVEFFPNASAPAPPPPPAANKNNSTPPPPPPANNTSIKNIGTGIGMKAMATSIAGVWAGTYGNGEANSSSYYSFRFNADGTMQVLDQNRTVSANGTYRFDNNQLSATYKYNNGGEFSVAASMANGALSGTWGSGKNASGGGKWIMTKQGGMSDNLR